MSEKQKDATLKLLHKFDSSVPKSNYHLKKHNNSIKVNLVQFVSNLHLFIM